MINKIKLSIIVPMYNAEKYISNCLDSLLGQGISSDMYEIIVVNDGSTDDGEKIVNGYQEEYKNIRLITVENGGQSYARNIGINNAVGEYLFFVDSDDYISNKSISEILIKTVENNFDMMFFDLKRVTTDLEIECSYKNTDKILITDGIEYFSKNNVNNGPWHYFISKRFINENNLRFVEGRFCEDGMFLISCIFAAKRVSYCKVDVYRYVVRPNSTTTKKPKEHLTKMIDDFMYAIDYINKYYEEALIRGYSKEFLERLRSRRNSYIYFMQIRMIKSKVGFKYANEIINKLKAINCYKYKRMNKSEYGDLKTTAIWMILNNKLLFCSLC